MKQKQSSAEASCVHNSLINCTGASARCNYCGWNPEVHKRRMATIHDGRLSVWPNGRKYLDVSKFQNAPQIPEERKNADAV